MSDSASCLAILKKQHLFSFLAGQGTLVPCVLIRFSSNFQASSCGFFVLFVFFPDEIAFSSFLRNGLKRFALVPFYRSRKKKSQLASNFKLTRKLTIYGEHGIMAHIP